MPSAAWAKEGSSELTGGRDTADVEELERMTEADGCFTVVPVLLPLRMFVGAFFFSSLILGGGDARLLGPGTGSVSGKSSYTGDDGLELSFL
jgi:hypothetical protein